MLPNLPIQLGDLHRQFLVCPQQLAHPYERPHNKNARLYRLRKIEHTRQHDSAVFGECMRQVLSVQATTSL